MRPRPTQEELDHPTLKGLRELRAKEIEYSYTLDNMGKAYDRSLDRTALLDVMIKNITGRYPR